MNESCSLNAICWQIGEISKAAPYLSTVFWHNKYSFLPQLSREKHPIGIQSHIQKVEGHDSSHKYVLLELSPKFSNINFSIINRFDPSIAVVS